MFYIKLFLTLCKKYHVCLPQTVLMQLRVWLHTEWGSGHWIRMWRRVLIARVKSGTVVIGSAKMHVNSYHFYHSGWMETERVNWTDRGWPRRSRLCFRSTPQRRCWSCQMSPPRSLTLWHIELLHWVRRYGLERLPSHVQWVQCLKNENQEIILKTKN